MLIRAVIADDEELARRRLDALLADAPDVEVVARCADGRATVETVRRLSPDLLFLDVQMPEMDGFAALAELGAEAPRAVVFTTAYDQYALRAFDIHAVDYLLKPFDARRFQAALQRAREILSARQTAEMFRGTISELLHSMQTGSGFLARFVLRSAGRISFRNVTDLSWAEAEGNYVRLHFGSENHLQREKLSALAEKLDPRRFARPHRSALVNIERIREMRQVFHGDYVVILEDGTEITLGKPYREKFLEQVGRG